MGDFDMAIKIRRGQSDEVIEGMIEALRAYAADHPNASIELYRQNSVSVRVRIVDPDFEGCSKSDRHKEAWKYLNSLDDEVQADLSSLILLTPQELDRSLANLEFEDPVSSNL
jgi:hypothetical protein